MEEPDRLGQAAEKIRRYIRKNYMRDISMQDAARMMNYSDAYFCKLFKQCFNKNFTSYLTEYRFPHSGGKETSSGKECQCQGGQYAGGVL